MSPTPQTSARPSSWRAFPVTILLGLLCSLLIILALVLFLNGAIFTDDSRIKWGLYSGGCILLLVTIAPLSYVMYKIAQLKFTSQTNGRQFNGARGAGLSSDQPIPQEGMGDQDVRSPHFPTSSNIDLPPPYESVVIVGQTDLSLTNNAMPMSVSPSLPNTAAASERATQTVVTFLGSHSTSDSGSSNRTTAPEVMPPDPSEVDGPPPPYSPQTLVMYLGSYSASESASTSTEAVKALSLTGPGEAFNPPPPYSSVHVPT